MAYERIDWRGEVPGQPWSNIGAREKDKGVVVHYAGLPTGLGRGGPPSPSRWPTRSTIR